ncbi:hypothetical protein Tco_1161987 [Tanacetum coccineum]
MCTSSNSQIHNDIMAAGSKEHPPMLALSSYIEITHPKTPEDGDRPMVPSLKHGESINIQDVKTKLLWEFGKFTSRNRESIESYYTRFYRIMNEMVRNKLKQANNLDNVSHHTLFDILKQHQNKVNEIRAERIARNANPLALVAVTQNYPDDYYQAPPAPKHFKTYTPSSIQTTSTRTHVVIRNKGNGIIKPPTPPSDLRTLSNTSNKNVDTSSRIGNDRKTRQFVNQRAATVVGKGETVRNQVVQQSGIQCLIAKGLDILLRSDTNEDPDEQELEAHYMYMAKIQEVLTADSRSTNDAEP